MDTNARKGIILIPDFSGFTEFVFNTRIYTGEFIVKELLSVLIEANNKQFYIAEIEGDAILFYKYNKYPSYKKIMKLLLQMLDAFNTRLEELNKILNTQIDLSLKFIVHYGTFSRYYIGEYKMLYGKTIIEAHGFLKNEHAVQRSYVLFSKSFLSVVTDSQARIFENSQYIPNFGMIHYIDQSLTLK